MDSLSLSATIRILHLEDSVTDHRLVCRMLDTAEIQYSIARVETLDGFNQQVRAGAFDLVLADYRLPGFTAMDAWLALVDLPQRPLFILLSGAIGEAAAVAAIQSGISDYLHKDDLEQLERVILRAFRVHEAKLLGEKAVRELAVSEQRLSAFTGHLQAAIERERASIAREVHDDIGGALAAARLDLAWLSRHTTDASIQSHIDAATEMLQHALGASQRIMLNLRPSILDQGLVAAVQWLAAGFEKRTGVQTALRTGSRHPNPASTVQLAAFRTVQEALTNISKYAQCKSVEIEISDAESVLTVEICDDGIGMTDEQLNSPAGFGIRGLRERAKAIGGWLDVSSRPGLGTSIILSVPLGENAHSEMDEGFL